jgi:Glycosyl transferase family 2
MPPAVPSMPDRNLTVIVPSRNRPEMAREAVESLLAQELAGVSIVVSDNSTDEHAREELAAACAALDGVEYMQPPEDLAMTDHWNWAFGQLHERFPAPLVTMLTDRMVMRPGALAGLLELAAAHPGRVVSYNHDAVDDTATPVRLRLEDRSGRVFELSVEHLLHRCSNMYFHPCIPRMMNCIVPLSVLDAVAARFGGLFASISPDHCFGFRCLEVVDTIVYYDACPLIHYGLARSNGATYARGVRSAAVEDFQRHLGAIQMNASAPVPGFHSITNAVVNEYCFVRDEPASRKLPALDMTRYLGVMARETSQLEDPGLREQMRSLLDQQGWRRKRLRYKLVRARDAIELLLQRPRPFLRMLRLGLADRLPQGLAPLLGARERRRSFASTEQALECLMTSEATGAPVHVHLLPLILPPGAALDVTHTRGSRHAAQARESE